MAHTSFNEHLHTQLQNPDIKAEWDRLEPQYNFITELMSTGVTITEEFWLALDTQFEELAKKGLTLTVVPVNVKHETVAVEELEYA